MPRTCPQCSQVNQEDMPFCRFCGYRFPDNGPASNEDATIRQASFPGVPPDADPSATLKTGDQPAALSQRSAPVAAPPQSQVASPSGQTFLPPVATPHSQQSQAPFMTPPVQQGAYPMQPPYGQPPYGAPYMAQVPTASSSVLQRAFAGRGTPIHHQSWLVDGKQAQAAALRNTLVDTIQRQGVMGVTATPERLREYGIGMEERDYVHVQYGASAVYVYMAPMGPNLYVSRTSTIQQPLSRVRMVVLAALLILMLICLLLYALVSSSIDGSLGAFGFAVTTFFGYAFFGLLFFFLFLFGRAIVFALTDKDFLAFLRPNRLSDFTLDTLSSIERVTDKAIRETLKQAGLNADEITSPPQNYPPQQALHRF